MEIGSAGGFACAFFIASKQKLVRFVALLYFVHAFVLQHSAGSVNIFISVHKAIKENYFAF